MQWMGRHGPYALYLLPGNTESGVWEMPAFSTQKLWIHWFGFDLVLIHPKDALDQELKCYQNMYMYYTFHTYCKLWAKHFNVTKKNATRFICTRVTKQEHKPEHCTLLKENSAKQPVLDKIEFWVPEHSSEEESRQVFVAQWN